MIIPYVRPACDRRSVFGGGTEHPMPSPIELTKVPADNISLAEAD